jgi:Cu/Ag efflux protein CusF
MSRILSATAVVLCLAWPMAAMAQGDKTVMKGGTVTATATIKAIDHTARSVTLRSEKGDEDTFTVSPDVTRFDQLKVGDQIRLTYHESLVFQVRKQGAPAPASGDAMAAGRLKSMPGGAVATQQLRTVTVKAVDPSVPSITVVTSDGRTITRKIDDKKNIEGVKPGDLIDITYTQALIVNAEPVK